MQAEDTAGRRSLAEVAWLLHRSLEVPVVVEGVLLAAKRLLHAETAEVSLVRGAGVAGRPGAGATAGATAGVAAGGRSESRTGWWRVRISADDWMDAREDDALEPLEVACVAGSHALLAPRRARAGAGAEADFLASRGFRDAMLAPLHGSELTSLLLVANRRGRLGRPGAFTHDDGDLLERLADEASLALDHALLVARLRAATSRRRRRAARG